MMPMHKNSPPKEVGREFDIIQKYLICLAYNKVTSGKVVSLSHLSTVFTTALPSLAI